MSVSRRGFLGLAGAGAAAVAAGGFVGRATADTAAGLSGSEPFFGTHQAGILTPAPDRLHFAAFDLSTDDPNDVIGLLKDWTGAAARMTQGLDAGPAGAVGGAPLAPPDDTGEALGLPPSMLTITFGFGPGLFEKLRIEDQRPAALIDLPHFPGDVLEPLRSGGDLCVQACANDPQVAVHAVRNLARIAFGRASVRWSQLGFGRTSSTSAAQQTPRNLFGFKDGTANVVREDPDAAASVWATAADGPAWMAAGSYLVCRRIRMTIETWDRTSLQEQEQIVGRAKGSGAPLTGTAEFDPPDFAAAGPDGRPAIGPGAHIRLAHPSAHGGVRMLRRGYNFVDGNDQLGRLDAGLFFLAYQRDIRTAFLPVQRALSRSDTMNEYIRHTGSAVFAVPPGVPGPGGWIGQPLLG